MKKNNKGFTLVEVVITVGIIAILAVVGGISISIWISKARDAQVVNNVQTIAGGLESYHMKNFEFPVPDGNILPDDHKKREQGIIGSGVIKKLSSFINVKNLSNSNKYIYSTYQIYDHYQVIGLLENDVQIQAYEYIIDKAHANTDKIVELGDKGYYSKGTVENIPMIINENNKTLVLEGNDGTDGGTTGNYSAINNDGTNILNGNPNFKGVSDLTQISKNTSEYIEKGDNAIIEIEEGIYQSIDGKFIKITDSSTDNDLGYTIITYNPSNISGEPDFSAGKNSFNINGSDPKMEWGCNGKKVSDNGSDGKIKTEEIVNFHDDNNNFSGYNYTSYTGDYSDIGCNSGNDGNVGAIFCNNLVFNGHNNWYLPSSSELNIIKKQNLLIENRYFSASEYGNNGAWTNNSAHSKNYDRYIRCIRRE
ncbi:prepilin-type N-terminal cleavage/methylation domain-containing protein [Candidatus Vampirococcus lugosii]|uniref:Type II secretory pathway, pseudopilin PulG n=1 Tax=Candidatus Vampirococcus lugosii TaxID=2789015 RepID=A0ABS5QM43_9BACT|nr:prepilin-type N-terminal cleavage/methylation domain-containing protein [Candidatus Vampirococcus lugosii]MBS8122275.1 Type II secretory pathway, pseudopilin PulG [Candidatus Vampirococcus lugosii]